MKYSFHALQQYIPELNKIKPSELFDILSTRLSEVEQVEDLSVDYKNLLVAQVVNIKKHPNSNKLFIVDLDIGENIVQVVAGAGNMKKGDFVPYTPVGVKVPRNAYPQRFDGIVRKIKLAGVESNGMLNSEYELNISDDHSGILILKQEELLPDSPRLKPGLALDKVLGFNDYLIEIENKSMTHRGDVFSHLGLANELGAILNEKVKTDVIPYFNQHLKNIFKEVTNTVNPRIKLNHVANGALRYRLVFVDLGKQIKDLPKSPLWLKVFLGKFGINPINIIVDLTNYIALMYGQPMHAFDYDKLLQLSSSKRIIINVDYVNSGTLKALDGKTYKLRQDTLTILLERKPIALAGVIGGVETAIDNSTSRILLEVATFSYSDIRRTSMLYGLNTLASIIYSRQQDPAKVDYTSSAYVDLLNSRIKLQDFTLQSDHKNVISSRPEIKVDLKYLKNMIPIVDLNAETVVNVLRRLRFEVNQIDTEILSVVPPEDRMDVNIKEDLVEEIVRIIGYEKVRVSLPKSKPVSVSDDPKVKLKDKLAAVLVSKGYVERVGLGFISERLVKKLNFDASNLYHIINAVSPEVNYYRPFISIQALESIKAGMDFADLYSIFEIGHTAIKSNLKTKEDNNANNLFFDLSAFKHKLPYPNESIHLALLLASRRYSQKELLAKLKTDIAWLLRDYQLYLYPLSDSFDHQKDSHFKNLNKWKGLVVILNKYNSAFVVYKDSVIGVIGAINSKIKSVLNLPGAVAFTEIELNKLITAPINYTVRTGSKFTPIIQDFTFVVPQSMSYSDFIKTLNLQLKELMEKGVAKNKYRFLVDIIDIYDEQDTYFVTVRLRFIPNVEPTDNMVQRIRAHLIQLMADKGLKLKGVAN